MATGKSTVLKRMANKDIADEYMKDEPGVENVVPCPYLEDGQEFIVENWGVTPDGFCSWVWMDIHKGVMLVMGGRQQSIGQTRGGDDCLLFRWVQASRFQG